MKWGRECCNTKQSPLICPLQDSSEQTVRTISGARYCHLAYQLQRKKESSTTYKADTHTHTNAISNLENQIMCAYTYSSPHTGPPPSVRMHASKCSCSSDKNCVLDSTQHHNDDGYSIRPLQARIVLST